MTLRDFHNSLPSGVTHLWVCGAGCPGGQAYRHNTEADIDEDYCDIVDLIGSGLGHGDFWELEGEADEDGWEWDGEGCPTDFNGNSYQQIVANS